MEKYKSDFIKSEDIKISTDYRYINTTKIHIVEIKHLPSGFIISAEDKSQLKAYNLALKELEDKIENFICDQF